jgi:hypothetical protein
MVMMEDLSEYGKKMEGEGYSITKKTLKYDEEVKKFLTITFVESQNLQDMQTVKVH